MTLVMLEDMDDPYDVILNSLSNKTIKGMSFVNSTNLYNTFSTNQEPAKAYINKFFSNFLSIKNIKVDSGLLQPGVKMIGDNYLIFERPPTFKNIFYVPTTKSSVPDITSDIEDSQKVFRIPIPWQLYFVKFNNDMYTYEVRMYFMNNSLVSTNQVLCLPPLPNFYTNGMLCSPSMANMEDVDRYSKDISGIMACAYDWVWNSGTNHDLTEACLSAPTQMEHSSGIFQNISQEEMNLKFSSRNYNSFAAQPYEVSSLLFYWEKFSLLDVCNMRWPNISGVSQHYSRTTLSDNSRYYDYLVEYLTDVVGVEEDDVEDVIENGDYNSDHYSYWIVENNKIDLSSTSVYPEYTYGEIIPFIIDKINKELSHAPYSFFQDIANHQSSVF